MYDGTTAAPKHHARGRAFVALLTIGLLTLATGAAAWSTTGETSGSGQSSGRDGDKVKICHRTAAETNPYRIPPVDSAGAANAHMDHTGPIFGQQAPGQKWGDIIEPFTFRGQDFPGLNWTAEGQEIWKNGCAVPPVDVCADGNQPPGTVVDENGDCVSAPGTCQRECDENARATAVAASGWTCAEQHPTVISLSRAPDDATVASGSSARRTSR